MCIIFDQSIVGYKIGLMFVFESSVSFSRSDERRFLLPGYSDLFLPGMLKESPNMFQNKEINHMYRM